MYHTFVGAGLPAMMAERSLHNPKSIASKPAPTGLKISLFGVSPSRG